jgi:ankyrin repeat protein
MSTPSTLVSIAPELLLAIAEHLPLDALQALIRCNSFLYHLLLDFLYRRAIAEPPTFKCRSRRRICLLDEEDGWKGRPWMGNARQVTLSLAAGLDVNMIVHCRSTRLHLAASNFSTCEWPGREADKGYEEEEEVMRILLAHGADVNAAEEFGHSPLLLAAMDGSLKMVKLLFEHGADLNKAVERGKAPLHWVVRDSGKMAKIRFLLEHGADPNQLDSLGSSPLHFAVRHSTTSGSPSIVAILLEHGADPNIVNRLGKSPLHYALKYAPGLTRLLLERGAGPNNVNVRQSPLQDALLGLKTEKSDDERLDTEREQFDINWVLMNAGAVLEMPGEREWDLVKTSCERQTLFQPTPALVRTESSPTNTISPPQMSPAEAGEVRPQVREKEGGKEEIATAKGQEWLENAERNMKE